MGRAVRRLEFAFISFQFSFLEFLRVLCQLLKNILRGKKEGRREGAAELKISCCVGGGREGECSLPGLVCLALPHRRLVANPRKTRELSSFPVSLSLSK
ncbi:hypothetical protein chiPu_0010647 [Chiloscyllium punctatum]|uniref:Uncharacterized protein n=1 Tax=Chiloscyllium punctatum TaxID=137246 RepID=A0A401SP73_CHIPU|nr:hypothetical protein [Chiloscyllium punctatum]